MSEIQINQAAFISRLKLLYELWNEGGEEWAGATALAFPVGASSNELHYYKSIALQLWLTGYELPDTIFAFTKDSMHLLASGKKAGLLQSLVEAAKQEVGVDIHFYIRGKADDGSAQVTELLDVLKASADSPVLGVLTKERPEGKLAELWQGALGGSGMDTADVAAGLAAAFAVKDDQEILSVKKAAYLGTSAMKVYAVPQLESIIDDEKKVKHAKLSSKVEEAITNPSEILNIKLKQDNVDIAYAPIVQSGGHYDLKPSATSSDGTLQYDVVIISLGTRYSSYCANIARTLLVDPNKQQEEEYKAVLSAQEAAISALRPGQPMSAAFEAAVAALQAAGQGALVDKLQKNVGFGMGLEFRESSRVLNAKNTATVKAGMVFNVAVGVSDLRRADPNPGQASAYALLVADTVVVRDQETEVTTSASSKAWSEIAYYVKDDAEEKPAPKPEKALAEVRGATKKTALRSEEEDFRIQNDMRRKQKENQEELQVRINEETLRQLKKGSVENGAAPSGRKVSEVVAYRSANELPTSVRDLCIQVDQKNECVLVPIYGVLVPFHILTVRNASSNQDGDHAYIRLNFHFGPGYEPGTRFPDAIFLKELSFRSADSRHAVKVVQEIKVLRSAVTQRERETMERATLVQQERLVKSKGRVYTLPDVWIRPPFGGKGRKQTGVLEAHTNGFHYSTPKGESIDVMYSNIKHAFYQPAENEMITLVHFHLHNPIMVGKKKTSDVQFFTEVMESVQTLDGGRRSMYDPDEIEEEQRERDNRNKINKQFQQFVKRVHNDIWERDYRDSDLDFEIPFRDLGFWGVPNRSTVFIMPTVRCLVELTELPFTVINTADITLVNLERVGFNLKNFDMAIVFKELTREAVRIDAIDMKHLESIKEWLSSMDIKYYENKMNLNWKAILKNIQEDPDAFEEGGGWSFLDADKSDSEGEEEEEEEGDEEFAPDSDEDEEESESEGADDSDDESVVDSDEEEDGEDDSDADEEEEEGLSWDELEEQAKREDRDAHDEDSDDERDRKRKRGGGGGGSAAGKRARR